MIPFSKETRARILEEVGQRPYDLIVIGGGITGAGVLRDAVQRGLRVLLLEQTDFGAGTSSKSSKLVHGGLRYLKQYDFGLTREACLERNLLVKRNPHLVKPIPFLFPIYRTDKEGPLTIRAGMWLYEALAGFGNFQRHKMLSAAEALRLVPDLRPDGLRAAAWYFDAAVDDVRLTLENIKAGVAGGGMALNHAPVTGLIHQEGQVVGVLFRDKLSGRTYEARGQVVLNATGVWVDTIRNLDAPRQSRLSPSKGVHLVVPRGRIRQDATVAFSAPQDRRMLFCIPWDDVTVIGTTDTFFHGDPDAARTESEDVRYLLEATNHLFPGVSLTEADLVSSYVGVRPLIAPDGDTANASAVSREHQIFEDPSGLLSIAGGKLTTYRLMAGSLVDKAVARLPMEQRRQLRPAHSDDPLPSAVQDVTGAQQRLMRAGQPEVVARHLVETYGGEAEAVLALCDTLEGGQVPLRQGHGYLRGEVLYAVRFESTFHLTDLLTRRLRFSLFVPDQGLDVAEDCVRLMAQELGWDEATCQEELAAYQEAIRLSYRPVNAG